MVMTHLPAYHPGNFLMKNIKSPNSVLTLYGWKSYVKFNLTVR